MSLVSHHHVSSESLKGNKKKIHKINKVLIGELIVVTYLKSLYLCLD